MKEEYKLKGEYCIYNGYFINIEENLKLNPLTMIEGFFLGITSDTFLGMYYIHLLRVRPEADGTYTRFVVILREREAGEVLIDILRYLKGVIGKYDSTLVLRLPRNKYPIPLVSCRKFPKGSFKDISTYSVYKSDYSALIYTINSLLSTYISEEVKEKAPEDVKKAIAKGVRASLSDKEILGKVDLTYRKLVKAGFLPAPIEPVSSSKSKNLIIPKIPKEAEITYKVSK